MVLQARRWGQGKKNRNIKIMEVKMKNFYFLFLALILMDGATAQWIPQYSGTTKNLNSVHFTDVNTGYAVGDSGTILKTTDGGEQWNSQNSGTIKSLRSVSFTSSEAGCAVGESGTILKTNDGGLNWEIRPSGTSVNLFSVHFPCADTGYICGSYDGDILKTSDGGLTWISVMPNLSGVCSFHSVFFTDANIGYVVGGFNFMTSLGVILKTINGGNDWTIWGGIYPPPYRAVFFVDENTGYVIHGAGEAGQPEGYLAKTDNGGENWSLQDNWYDFDPKSIFFLNADTGFVVCSCYMGGAILKTVNGGLNLSGWIIPTFSYSSALNSVYFTDAETGYVVGDGGTILKTTDGGGFPVGIENTSSDSKYIKIYPVPSSDKITFETPADGHLSVQNLNGHELLNQHISDPSSKIDITSLPNGVYFLKLTNKKTVQVGKFIKE